MTKLAADILFSILISSDPLKKADAIVLLEGDYYSRVKKTSDLFKKGFGRWVVVSGGVDDAKTGQIHARKLAQKLCSLGVPRAKIILEEKSQNTAEQAREVILLAKKRKWTRIILVASPFHQFRAFLTFLYVLKKSYPKLGLYSSPARKLPWFEKIYGGTRYELLEDEFSKIRKYKKKYNNVASFKEGIEYLKWRESRR
ncbi:MAG: YdcF family protein [bacterium]|nr:YdcF family protein [bacterium]